MTQLGRFSLGRNAIPQKCAPCRCPGYRIQLRSPLGGGGTHFLGCGTALRSQFNTCVIWSTWSSHFPFGKLLHSQAVPYLIKEGAVTALHAAEAAGRVIRGPQTLEGQIPGLNLLVELLARCSLGAPAVAHQDPRHVVP